MRETRVGMERTKFGKKRDPLQYSRVLSKCAFEPAESFFFVAKGDINCGDHRRRDVSLLPRLQELSKNISRLYLAAHARVGDGKAAAREMRCIVDAVVSQVGGGGNITSDRRHGIQLLSLQHQSESFR